MSKEMNTEVEYGSMKIAGPGSWLERREHRRHDLEQQGLSVERFDGRGGKSLGRLVDISAGGLCLRSNDANVRADQQIRVRLELPNFAGISPFVARTGETLVPRREWVGWMTVARVSQAEKGETEVAGRLVDMDEMDRGMLSLYLSTQPLAA
jgi:PilZ domain